MADGPREIRGIPGKMSLCTYTDKRISSGLAGGIEFFRVKFSWHFLVLIPRYSLIVAEFFSVLILSYTCGIESDMVVK